MKLSDNFLAIALLAMIALALAICGGAWGLSDLEIFQQTAKPSFKP